MDPSTRLVRSDDLHPRPAALPPLWEPATAGKLNQSLRDRVRRVAALGAADTHEQGALLTRTWVAGRSYVLGYSGS
jgi:hypothetical protein